MGFGSTDPALMVEELPYMDHPSSPLWLVAAAIVVVALLACQWMCCKNEGRDVGLPPTLPCSWGDGTCSAGLTRRAADI